ncbi:MAG TPA: Gfo/Idh/MocA family oxidoreductase [Pyrinomonadaceae bacterium]
MNQIKIGILGAGYIGSVHGAVLARDERVRIAAIHDVVPKCSQELARAHNATSVATPLELLERSDAVYITTPNTQHVSLAIAAIETGKHVFCEKPLATNVADAQAVFEKANESEKIFQVGHNRRFAPVYAELKRLLSETHTPHSAHVKMNRGELLKPDWTGNPEITGGFLYETPIHMFDMMRFLFGEVESLHAIGSKHEYNEVDDFSVLMKFANGMHATLATAADASWLFPFERVEVFCHHATLVTREMESLTCSTNLEGYFNQQSMQQLSREEKWGYAQEDRAFIDSIVNNSPPLVTAHDGLMSVELANAVYESVKSGQSIKIP